MRKVRITALPKAQSGLEVKMKSGLGFNSNVMPWPIMAGEFSEPEIEVNKTLLPVAREGANLEAELGEYAFTDKTGDGIPQLYRIGGKRHYDGGTPLNLPDDSFIYSRDNSMKIGGDILNSFGKNKGNKKKFTPAELASQYQINDFRKVLADKDTDKTQRETAELMIANYNLKLAKLGLVQESTKGFPDGIPRVSMPYMEMMGIDPSQFFGQQGQEEQGEPEEEQEYQEGQEEQPLGDNTARYGGGNFLPMHKKKGVTKTAPKKRTTPVILPGENINTIYRKQQELLGMNMSDPNIANLYDLLDKKYKYLWNKGNRTSNTGTNPKESGWYDAEGRRMADIKGKPIKTGAWDWGGYQDKIAHHISDLWTPGTSTINTDLSNIPASGSGTVPSLAYKNMHKNTDIIMHPSHASGVMNYIGNAAKYPVSGVNAFLTGEWKNPDYFMADVALDPSSWLGAKEAEIIGTGVKKVVKAVPELATKTAELVKLYGPQVYEVVAKYGTKAIDLIATGAIQLAKVAGPKITKVATQAVKSPLVRTTILKGLGEAADEEPEQTEPAYMPRTAVPPKPKYTPIIRTGPASAGGYDKPVVKPKVVSKVTPKVAPKVVKTVTTPATTTTKRKALPDSEYEWDTK